MGSSDNSTKLASTAYVQSKISTTTSLDVGSAQSISATTITPAVKIDTVDTASAGTLQIGLATDSGIQIGGLSTISMLGYVQPFNSIFKYLVTGCTNTVASLGTAVSVQKIYAGTASMSGGSATITFSPAFTNNPIIVLGLVCASGGSPALLITNKWVSAVSTSSATINSATSSTFLSMNWIAVGT
jgi:hypothetical protein